MTPESFKTFRKWLDDKITDAEEDAAMSGGMTDWSNGVDSGYLVALRRVREYFTGESE